MFGMVGILLAAVFIAGAIEMRGRQTSAELKDIREKLDRILSHLEK